MGRPFFAISRIVHCAQPSCSNAQKSPHKTRFSSMRLRDLGRASRRLLGKAFGRPFGSAFSHVALLVTNARKRYIEIWHFFSGEMPKHMHGNAGKQVRILRSAATVRLRSRARSLHPVRKHAATSHSKRLKANENARCAIGRMRFARTVLPFPCATALCRKQKRPPIGKKGKSP